jgi:hypothetical protein
MTQNAHAPRRNTALGICECGVTGRGSLYMLLYLEASFRLRSDQGIGMSGPYISGLSLKEGV